MSLPSLKHLRPQVIDVWRGPVLGETRLTGYVVLPVRYIIYGFLMQLVDILACHARYTGSSPVGVAIKQIVRAHESYEVGS